MLLISIIAIIQLLATYNSDSRAANIRQHRANLQN
jgi:hypothetical protein